MRHPVRVYPFAGPRNVWVQTCKRYYMILYNTWRRHLQTSSKWRKSFHSFRMQVRTTYLNCHLLSI